MPLGLFAFPSLLGIIAVLHHWVVWGDATQSSKIFVVATTTAALLYESAVSFSLAPSGINWHLGHAFITHACLSLLPPVIAQGWLRTNERA